MNSSPVLLASCLVFLLISCSLAAHDRITTKVTWDREIAPIVQARCVSCHSAGGRAPMALTTYEEARPWAKAIKEEVLARRMPKWHVVRGYGDFRNDPSLSAFEIALVAAWADGGAPKSGPSPAAPPHVKSIDTPPTRPTELSCSSTSLPRGRLVALKPSLAKGESLRLTLVRDDGTEEPLLWVRDFDPAFAETYWLRNPVHITRNTRVRADAAAPCTVTALMAVTAASR